MTSTIKLYIGVPITPENNFAVDDITTYLEGLNASRIITFIDQNYVKQDLSIQIRLPLKQEALGNNNSNYNYCEIQNWKENGVPDKKCYYFITAKRWASKEILICELLMDTINTIGTNVQLTEKTMIYRENRNRWEVSGASAIGIVDKFSEGITPTLYKDKETILKSNVAKNNFKWYLAFVNNDAISETAFNQVNPIKCLIAPAHSISMYISGSETISMDSLYHLISPIHNNTNKSGQVRAFDGTNHFLDVNIKDISEIDETSIDLTTYPTTKTVVSFVVIYPNAGKYNTTPYVSLYDESGTLLHLYTGTTIQATAFSFINFNGAVRSRSSGALGTNPYSNANETFYGSTTQITGIDTLNKTLDILIKIVELPYCPITIKDIHNGYYIFDLPCEAESDSGNNFSFIKVLGVNLEYYNSLIDITTTDFSEILNLKKLLNVDFLRNQLKDKSFEPKLYHSELYSKKFIYDSFDRQFKFENVDVANSQGYGAHIKFNLISSLAITSKFLFDFSEYWQEKTKEEDYPGILPISRNNEIVIYTNQYLNYLRNQKDYDLKVQEAQKRNSHILANIGIASGISGMASSMAGSADSASGINTVVQGYAGIFQKGFSISENDYLRNEAQRQKEKDLLRQQTSVTGADDLGLLNYYTKGNYPKICTYKPNDNVKNHLFDIFHFTGYIAGYSGIPKLNTRLRFNYIQADISIQAEYYSFLTLNYNEDIITNYRSRWASGLTIIHKYNNAWDFEQKYENWESILESYLQ